MSERAMRTGLIVFGLISLVTGGLMFVVPHWFFDHIGPYGVRNNHYLGDLGAAFLAGGTGLVIAARRPSWRVPLLSVNALWYGLHAINHLFDIEKNNRGDLRGWTDFVLIAIGAIALAYLARVANQQEAEGGLRTPPPAPRRPRDYPPGD